jgi:hypothetical protein
MDDQVKQQEKALRALIKANKRDVISLLRKYSYRVSLFSSDDDLYAFTIVAISKNAEFTDDVLTLLKQVSGYKYRNTTDSTSGNNTATIIAGALEGLGMVTSTWQNVATIKANASNYNTAYSTDGKKTNTIIIAVAIGVGVLLLGVAGVMVVKAAK